MWTVYMHTSPHGKKYVGITSKEPIRRWGCKGQGYSTNKHFFNAISKYGWDNFKHDVLYENLTHEQASQKEKELIQKYKTFDPAYGYNIALGGQGHLMTEETKEKLSQSLKKTFESSDKRQKIGERTKKMWSNPEYKEKHTGKNHPMYGRTHTEEARKKISEARKGKPTNLGRKASPETLEKMRIAGRMGKGKKISKEGCEHIRQAKLGAKNPNYGKPMRENTKKALLMAVSKPLYQIDGTKKIYYLNAQEAARRTGICAANINGVCNGKRKTAGGYVWEFCGKDTR